jgi:histone-lysine N-methyltransferase SETD3
VTDPLKVGDVVIRIPHKVLMSVDTARDSEIGRLIEHDPMLQSMNNVALALHLLLEKTSPASFWEPYINTLPHTYTTVLYFSAEDFQALRGSVAFEDALKQYKNVARQYAYFYKKFQSTMLKDYFTYDEYRWAVSTVMTRQNEVRSLRRVFVKTKA